VAFGILVSLFALSRVFALSVGLLALAGCAMIVNNALTNTMLQTLVPDRLRGRVMGFYSFVFVGMAPLGAFLAGVTAEHVGAPAAVAAGGLVSALVVLTTAWRAPELRKTS
jgi:MFS family permease